MAINKNEGYNPIASVDGFAVKCPSDYKWELEDLSDADSGRTEDNVMHKNRKGQLVKLTVEWRRVSLTDAAEILKAFQPEYITVKYLDALRGRYMESVFYRGNLAAPMFSAKHGCWEKISFNLIERDGGMKDV